jgi:hypothetical protein
MNKLYDRIDWHNNTTPAINETNLNKMSKAIDDIDDRVADIAGTVMETVPEILDLYEDIEGLADHPPIIGNNGNWWTWDTETDEYTDSGIDAGVSVTIGTTTTLPPESDATVTNSGTATDPILNFGIPQGVAGVGVPSGGTTGQVLKKTSGTDYDTEWADADGGGHTILNGSGTAMTQRGKLQFVGADVVDDSANDKTIVTTTPQSMIGDAWVVSHAYAVGDYCIDGNVLYKCKTAHTSNSSNRPPYASYWDAVSVASQLKKLEGFTELSYTASTDIQNSILSNAKEIILCNLNFGFNVHFYDFMPDNTGYGVSHAWYGKFQSCCYMALNNSTPVYYTVMYYWNRQRGSIASRNTVNTYSGWSDSNGIPTKIFYKL